MHGPDVMCNGQWRDRLRNDPEKLKIRLELFPSAIGWFNEFVFSWKNYKWFI